MADSETKRLTDEVDLLIKKGLYSQAEEILEELIKRSQEDPRLWERYANLALRQRGARASIERWEEGMKRFPEELVFAVNYASALIDMSRYDEAENLLKDLREGSSGSDDEWLIFHLLATSQMRQRTYKETLPLWQEAYNKFPDKFPLRLGYGHALLEADCNEAAKRIYEKMIEEGIEHVGLYEGYAKSLLRTEPSHGDRVVKLLDEVSHLAQDSYTKINAEANALELRKNKESLTAIIRGYQKLCERNGFVDFMPYIERSVQKRVASSSPLADIHDYSWSDAGVDALYSTIKGAIDNNQPFSLVRVGDGERLVLSQSNKNLLGATATANSVPRALGEKEETAVLKMLHAALLNADVLGLPSEKLLITSEAWREVLRNLPKELDPLLFEKIIVTDPQCHQHLYWSGRLKRLLMGLDFCGYISTHDLDEEIKKCGIHRIDKYIVPGEEMYKINLKEDPHYPTYFREIVSSIRVPYAGALFLVGAGVLGKIYCDVIKEKGGCAIDIGVVMDWMAGVFHTRGTTLKQANRGFLPSGASA
ncbi:MAG: tetratricopeptide repeat protein [SAR324 cluster bacterium]|uniref:Tetratricopeptide repeat protein n=1 Tax=SAR324 cluster bacterium TaxID=2024889 RepID=A0A7X9FU99_9DELT|nr:tetratricopeptide repeat protein [SAR324 cluster bacterium]